MLCCLARRYPVICMKYASKMMFVYSNVFDIKDKYGTMEIEAILIDNYAQITSIEISEHTLTVIPAPRSKYIHMQTLIVAIKLNNITRLISDYISIDNKCFQSIHYFLLALFALIINYSLMQF